MDDECGSYTRRLLLLTFITFNYFLYGEAFRKIKRTEKKTKRLVNRGCMELSRKYSYVLMKVLRANIESK